MTDRMPPELLAALEDYERALAADDVEALDAAFAPGPATMRADAAGLLVGHDAISSFRSTRGGVPERVIERVEHRALGPDASLVVAVSRYAAGGTGTQTQLWQRVGGRWLITAAHVAPRPQPLDRTIWRTVGDPLRPGSADGPLAGCTVAVKDLFAIEGERIGAGNPTWLEHAPVEPAGAPAVVDLLRAGASLRGIARTDELAYSIAGDNPHHGTPPNGAVPGALPGGSSSGPASAVATGQADIALATDTAGSVRVPASYQGLWGLRTTHGLVPRRGLVPLAPSFDTVGWLTRDGGTLQRVVEACLGEADGGAAASGHDVPGAPGLEPPWRLGVPEEVLAAADPATAEAFEALLAALADLPGAPPIDRVSIGDLAGYADPFRLVQGAEAWRHHGDWVRRHPDALGPAVAERMRAASQVTADDEERARADLTTRAEHLRDVVTTRVLIAPTVPGPAPSRTATGDGVADVRTRTLRMTTPASVAGLPSLSLPLLTLPSPLGPAPVGVCLTSRAGSDVALVRLARRLADLLQTPPHGRSRS